MPIPNLPQMLAPMLPGGGSQVTNPSVTNPTVAGAPPPMGGDPMDALMRQLGPEGMQQILRMGSLDDQMAQAHALRKPGPQYDTPIAAGIGGLTDALRGIRGSSMERDVQGQKDAGLQAILRALRGPRNYQPEPGWAASPGMEQGINLAGLDFNGRDTRNA